MPNDGWQPASASASKAIPTSPAAAPAVRAAPAAAGKVDAETIDWGHWQLARDHVEVGKKIGSGEFGAVCKGIITGTGSNEGMTALVAIKIQIKGSRAEFMEEAKTMWSCTTQTW